MKILVLGNSSIFNRKVLPALIKFKNVSIEVASKRQRVEKVLQEVGEIALNVRFLGSYPKALLQE